jgi:transcriptional regulator with XRE-family HTH domain
MRTKGGGNPIDLLVGSRIRMFRKGRKMSQAQLGKKLGVTFQLVQKYENGKNRVGASRLQMISTALDVPVGQLFTDGAGTSRTPANHWHLIHRRYGLPKHLSGSTIERCATRFLIWLRPWRENRLVSDMAWSCSEGFDAECRQRD